ncbi:MAG TPA: cation diffusion facilitator family transporter [Streptosporangiaceae bacterium]|jgi:cobalt-zinc-cadmium efflux system protein
MTGHDHGGLGAGPTAAMRNRGRLAVVFGITLAIVVAEIVGALVSGSLALLAEAGHMAADTAGIGLSLLAVWFAGRPANAERTFGYQRMEILAAMINAMLLFAMAAFVLYEAVKRLTEPPEVNGGLMIVFGLLALAGNTASMLVLRGGQKESLNVRGAFLEVFSDMLGGAAIVVSAIVLWTTGFTRADAIVAAVIGLLILPRTWKLLREAVNVLLEATPKDVDLEHVRSHILRTPGVVGVHDLHAWTITSGVPVLSAHVVVDDDTEPGCGGGRVLDQLCECLSHHFDVEHCTFQLEPATHRAHEAAVHP